MKSAKKDGAHSKRILLDHKEQSSVMRDFTAYARARIAEQERAIFAVGHALERAFSGFRNPCRPAGMFLFLGPSGSGKTRLVQVLAEFILENPDGYICVDGSDYYDRHTVSRLIGAPMGYVGYDEEPKITQEKLDKPAFELSVKRFLGNLPTQKKRVKNFSTKTKANKRQNIHSPPT